MKVFYLDHALSGRGLHLEVSRSQSLLMTRRDLEVWRLFTWRVPDHGGFDLNHLGIFYLESSRSWGFDLDHLGIFYLESSRSWGFDLDHLGIFIWSVPDRGRLI